MIGAEKELFTWFSRDSLFAKIKIVLNGFWIAIHIP